MSTAFLTRFETILSMTVLYASQVLHQSFAGMAPRATAKSSVASQGWLRLSSLNRYAFLLSLLISVLVLVFVPFLIRLPASTSILKIATGIREVRKAFVDRTRYL